MPAVRGSPSVSYTLGPGYPTPGVLQLLVLTGAVFVLQTLASFNHRAHKQYAAHLFLL